MKRIRNTRVGCALGLHSPSARMGGGCYCSKKLLTSLYAGFERGMKHNREVIDAFMMEPHDEGVVYSSGLGDDGINFAYIGCAYPEGCDSLIRNEWDITRDSGWYFTVLGFGYCPDHIPHGEKSN